MIIETGYPIKFRKKDARELGDHLKNRHSIALIGMKRVGISNFLRFFIYHKNIIDTYIRDSQKHIFIPVDLDDLVERELFPFWVLTLKRITDAVAESDINQKVKDDIESLFLDSIQVSDLFLMIEYVRRSLNKVIDAGYLPSIFFIRFDRIKDASTPEFFANLEGLKTSTYDRLAYVFTTDRALGTFNDKLFSHTSLSLASNEMYLKPADLNDLKIIYNAYDYQYKLKLTQKLKKSLLKLVGGYIQYLQLALIIINQKNNLEIKSEKDLFESLVIDERIILQSEELWEGLIKEEKQTLLKAGSDKILTSSDKESGKYLFMTGFLTKDGKLFSKIFDHYINIICNKNEEENSSVELSKKEHLLFTCLRGNLDQICDRETIIMAVWPEEETLGVSDWAIDRLIARLRGKLKVQKEKFEIITIKTRGFKLVEKS